MASRPVSRNNVLAGFFLVFGVVLAIVISMVLSSALETMRSHNAYTVKFSLAQGAAGIKKGSSVLLGGQEIGKVRGVRFEYVATDPRRPKEGERVSPAALDVAVDIAVRSEFHIYDNADFFLERPLLGSLSTINIVNVGNPETGGVELTSGAVVHGRLAPPSFLESAGFGSEQVAQVQDVIAEFRGIVKRNGERVDHIVANADTAVQRLSTQMPAWSDELDKTLASLERASRDLQPLVASANDGVSEAREAVRKVDAIVEDGGPKVSRILDNTQSATDKINTETVERANKALEVAQSTLDTISDAAATLSSLVREESPNLRRTLANARLASDQLKLATVEIRSQPWRLFYTPSTKETESSVLYDAARTYAEAASDLRAVSEALDEAVAAAAAPGVDGATRQREIEDLRARLNGALERYRETERLLMDKLIGQGGRSAGAGPGK